MTIDEFATYEPVVATDRVAQDMGKDWVRDPIHKADFLDRLKSDPEIVTRYFEEGRRPQRGLSVPVPKSSLTIRPAVELRLLDRVAYEALVDLFALEELAELPDFVCGWRFRTKRSKAPYLSDNQREWRRYEQQLEEEWDAGAAYILAADIAGFFQNIPHSILHDRLSHLHREIRSPLMDYLRIWNPTGVGLPQRVLGSSLLANMYLDPVDEVLSDYRSTRWMDDIIVFCDTRREGVEVMLRLQQAMQGIGLFPNAQKTLLLPYEDADAIVEFIRFRRIEYELDKGDDEGNMGLAGAWREAMNNPEQAERTKFSFCVSRFVEEGWDDPATEILANLNKLPHVSDHASRYLRSQLGERAVLETVARYLRSRTNQFVWQEYRLATLFWHAESLEKEQVDLIRRRLRNANAYWAARCIYARAIAKHGTRADAREMQDLAEQESNREVLRGLILGGAESKHLTPRALNAMGRDDPDLNVLISWLKSRDWNVPSLSF